VKRLGWLYGAILVCGCHDFAALSSQYGRDLACATCADLGGAAPDLAAPAPDLALPAPDLATLPPELLGSGQPTAASIDLTQQGVLDWAHWGHASPQGFDRKANVPAQISDLTLIGTAMRQGYGNNTVAFSWSDGTPNANVLTTAGVYIVGVGQGFSVSVPADTTTRVLRIFVGGYQSHGQLIAHLSDGSVSDYVDSTFSRSDGTLYNVMYELTFRAGHAGESLTVQWQALALYQADGSVALQSAALR
jgi:hypothetical protein